MARKCNVCSHADRERIDKKLIAGHQLRELSRQFQIDKSSLWRHKNNHIPLDLVKSHKVQEYARANHLADEIEALRVKAERISNKAEKKGDYRTALAGIRELTRIVELLAKLKGELHEQNINISLNTKWLELRSIIMLVLEDFPEAKLKVAKAIPNDCK
jgi:hypothetical protein